MAILGNLLRDVSKEIDDVEFHVPTTNAGFIRDHFKEFKVKPVAMMPWNGCIRNFGWPLYRAMTNTDLVLICDNILFDRKFYNPLFNNLSSIALFAPFCKKKGIPIVLYNVSVGPIDYPVGKKALQKVLDATELVVTRDTATNEIFDQLELDYPELHIHADCAMNTEPPPKQRLDEIIAKEQLFTNPTGTIGFNVNAYIDNWSKGGTFTRDGFCNSIAGAAERVIEELGVDVIFFVTQVMDMEVTRDCISRIGQQDRVKIISNVDYRYEEIAALLGMVELHSGLRTHSLIFAAAMETPMIGITSYPKSAGFLRTVGQGDWQVPFARLTAEFLGNMVIDAWKVREKTRKELAALVPQEKEKARRTAGFLRRFFA
jgi:polysaccharide pyruvyl transferase WcaK-like protein